MIRLTKAQLLIRNAIELDLLIIAPAGCGKTEALALRVAGLLERGQVAWPQKMLVTTFSNRARDNIKERLKSYVSPAAMRDRAVVANFHGLAARIFQAHANVIGLDPGMKIPDSDWVGDQCRSRNLTFQRSGFVQDALRCIKQQLLDDAAVEAAIIEAGDEVVLEIERQRKDEGRLTYDDLPRLAELILQNEVVADLYRSHFACLVIDELQDITSQQLRMVNRIGPGRTTYAGDLAQGIYAFAGAAPVKVFQQVETQVSRKIVFAESHRSSPSVLEMVNALSGLTGGQELKSAVPDTWPHGGLAGVAAFVTTADEADWACRFTRLIVDRAPAHRIGVIARTASRRRFADEAFKRSELPHYRWDDPVLDTDTAKVMKSMLAKLDKAECYVAPNLLGFLQELAGLESIQDPSTREALMGAVAWAHDLLRDGSDPREIRSRIKYGDGSTLLTAPGVHQLTGHVGKGQQFDWVVILGVEEGCIPDFRATTVAARAEEARVLSVMISRARHGVVLLRAAAVESLNGTVWAKKASGFLAAFDDVASCLDRSGVEAWLQDAAWDEIAVR
jgi:DNA helicase-2/ATP-dependent DNA helicase PcrA